MKKYLPILALSLALMGCTNSTTKVDESNKNSQIEESKEDDKKVIEVSKPKDKKEDPKLNDRDTEENNEKDYKKDKEDDREIEEKEDDNDKDKKGKNEVTANDLFFLPYGPFSSVNENGDLVDENGKELVSNESSSQYEYVKYTNNIFVKMKNEESDIVSIVKMNDKDLSTLYEFPNGEEFASLGMIGDRIYGYYYYQSDSKKDENSSLENYNTAIGYVDLATGEMCDYEDTKDSKTGGAVVVDGKLQFTKPGDNYKENAYNYDLYELDLSKDLDQKAELVEKDFDLKYLFGQKRFVDGKAVWNILRADNDNIYANDQKFPFLWAEAGSQEIIGNNIFYFPLDAKGEGDTDIRSRNLKVINLTSGETVLKESVRGIKIADGKLYYLTSTNQLESVDIEL